MLDIEILSANLRRHRKDCRMTQQEVADALSISPQSVSKWECGEAVPDLEKLCMLTEIFGVSAEQLIYGGANGRVMVAVDGGGTKTEFVLFNESGVVLRRLKKEGSNPNVCGFDKSIEILKSGISSFIREKFDMIGMFIGCAGFASGDYSARAEKALREYFPKKKIKCSSDIANIIASATDEKDCIAAICGTGMVVYASEGGRYDRVGGWGYLLEEGGSGYSIGRDALRAAFADRDGLHDRTLITSLVEERIGSSPWEHIGEIYKGGNSYIASFAPLVSAAYKKGDSVAEDILRKNAACLADCILTAHENHPRLHTVVLGGNVAVKDRAFVSLIREYLPDRLSLIIGDKPPVFGACVEAARLCGIDTAGLKNNFIESYTDIFEGE